MTPTPLRFAAVVFLLALAIPASTASADDESQPTPTELPVTIVPTDYLLLPAVGQYGRLPLQHDPLEAQIVAGTWKKPAPDDAFPIANGKSEKWSAAKADDSGTLDTQKFRGGYALATFDSPVERVMLLEAAGHAMVYVNGEPHAGDPYSLGWWRLPVFVKQGPNELLFHLGAEKLKARLIAPPQNAVFLTDSDRTLPTLVRSEKKPDWMWAAIPVVNATTDWLEGAKIECRIKDGEPRSLAIAPVPPLSVRKVPFQIPNGGDDKSDDAHYQVRLTAADAKDATKDVYKTLDEVEVAIKRVAAHDIQVRTFRSAIDGSVQSYAIRPAAKPASGTNDVGDADRKPPGLIVTLHAAGTSCEDHVAQYAAKSWAHILAPQGRRPHGFDWESWSRQDAFEAMHDAQEIYKYEPRCVYLTGHSMGGHGAWLIGATFPDKFAAIGPSSGWISYWSYGGGMPSMETPSNIDALVLRGYSASDTLKLLSNLANTGVYVLHGAADQTVPVAQARFMRTRLASFHPNFAYYEQPSADHWWGNECCDWPQLMEFFRTQSLPPSSEQNFIDFTTANPAVSNSCNWVSIEAQQEQLAPSHVAIRRNASARTFVGNTSNVTRLTIDVAHLDANQPIDVTLDGQALNWLSFPGDSRQLWFERQGDEWKATEQPEGMVKGPQRYGTFNSVFNRNAILVYGTSGTPEENNWAASKARYDAESFYYRGGGTLELLPDSRFDSNRDTNRNVILYGNADTNSAWPQLLASAPVEVRRGHVRVGTRTETGDDLAVVTVHPRPGSDVALVGVVAGTGSAGMRLTNRLRWFVAGVVYPDLMILEPKVLSEGTAGVRAWGYFGLDWGTETGEIAWRSPTR